MIRENQHSSQLKPIEINRLNGINSQINTQITTLRKQLSNKDAELQEAKEFGRNAVYSHHQTRKANIEKLFRESNEWFGARPGVHSNRNTIDEKVEFEVVEQQVGPPDSDGQCEAYITGRYQEVRYRWKDEARSEYKNYQNWCEENKINKDLRWDIKFKAPSSPRGGGGGDCIIS